jgi:hypothetical protein
MWETLSLKNQIEADKFDLQDREFKRGYPEKVCQSRVLPYKELPQRVV